MGRTKLRQHDTHKKKEFVCQFCGAKAQSRAHHFKYHKDCVAKWEEYKTEQYKNNPNDFFVKCPICGDIEPDQLVIHLQKKHQLTRERAEAMYPDAVLISNKRKGIGNRVSAEYNAIKKNRKRIDLSAKQEQQNQDLSGNIFFKHLHNRIKPKDPTPLNRR